MCTFFIKNEEKRKTENSWLEKWLLRGKITSFQKVLWRILWRRNCLSCSWKPWKLTERAEIWYPEIFGVTQSIEDLWNLEAPEDSGLLLGISRIYEKKLALLVFFFNFPKWQVDFNFTHRNRKNLFVVIIKKYPKLKRTIVF